MNGSARAPAIGAGNLAPSEDTFDDILEIARESCGAAAAMICVAGVQWCSAPADRAIFSQLLSGRFGALAREADDLLVVTDARCDPRIAQATDPERAPGAGFYAGVPLLAAPGVRVGLICVIDHAPRSAGLGRSQAATLRALARQVMVQVDLRRALMERDTMLEQQRLEAIRRETLVETQAKISQAKGDFAAILEILASGLMKAIPTADGGVIVTRAGDELVYRCVRGTLAGHPDLRLPINASLLGACWLSIAPILCDDVRGDMRADQGLVERLGVRSALFVPVVRGGEIIAAMMLQSKEPGGLSQLDLDVARLFAGTVAAGFAEVGEASARRQVRRGEQRHRAIFESAVDYAIIGLDLDGHITDWNEGARRLFGWTVEEALGGPAALVFTPEDRDAGVPVDEMRRALRDGRGAGERWHCRKDASRFWAIGEMMTLRDDDGTAIGFVKILRDRTEQREATALLQEQQRNLRAVLDTIPVGVLFAEAPSGRIVGGNRSAELILRQPIIRSQNIEAYDEWIAFHPDGRRVLALEYPLARIIRENLDHAALECEFQRGDGSRLWISITGAPMRHADGSIAGAVVAIADIDARRRAAEMQEIVNQELSHRMKNLLTVVQAITWQSIRGATDFVSLQHTLADRLSVLGAAHDILLNGPLEQAPIASLVRGGTGVLGDLAKERLTIEGDDLEIGGRAALPLGLMIHELSTNAVKYGALSTPEGRVHISWVVAPDDEQKHFVLTWVESGGPAVTAPTRKGFGSRLIERGVAGLIGGSVAVEFRPEGLFCRVQAPVSSLLGAT